VEASSKVEVDPRQRADLLLRDLRGSRSGLSAREAQRRLVQFGPNEIRRRERTGHLRALAAQFIHPLASLLWAALVPGDVLLITEGDRLCADARVLVGSVEVDMASLTGESQPVERSAGRTSGRASQQSIRAGGQLTLLRAFPPA